MIKTNLNYLIPSCIGLLLLWFFNRFGGKYEDEVKDILKRTLNIGAIYLSFNLLTFYGCYEWVLGQNDGSFPINPLFVCFVVMMISLFQTRVIISTIVRKKLIPLEEIKNGTQYASIVMLSVSFLYSEQLFSPTPVTVNFLKLLIPITGLQIAIFRFELDNMQLVEKNRKSS